MVVCSLLGWGLACWRASRHRVSDGRARMPSGQRVLRAP